VACKLLDEFANYYWLGLHDSWDFFLRNFQNFLLVIWILMARLDG
jgi:hypothetical protein